MLIFQIKRIISSKKEFNEVVTFFFFFKIAPNLGRSDDATEKKREWPKALPLHGKIDSTSSVNFRTPSFI